METHLKSGAVVHDLLHEMYEQRKKGPDGRRPVVSRLTRATKEEFEAISNTCPVGNLAIMGDPPVYVWIDTGQHAQRWYTEASRIIAPVKCDKMFANLLYRSMDLPEVMDTSEAGSLATMFWGCRKLKALDLSHWDTRGVKDISGIFGCCTSLVQVEGLASWDTRQLTCAEGAFEKCSALQEIEGLEAWDVSSLAEPAWMFKGCRSLREISLRKWKLPFAARDLRGMFEECVSLKRVDLSGWSTPGVEYIIGMFEDCVELASIVGLQDWKLDRLEWMSYTFSGCAKLKSLSEISFWDLPRISAMDGAFQACRELQSLDLSGWDLSSLKCADDAFAGCVNLKRLHFGGPKETNVHDGPREREVSARQFLDGCQKLEILSMPVEVMDALHRHDTDLAEICPRLRDLELF